MKTLSRRSWKVQLSRKKWRRSTERFDMKHRTIKEVQADSIAVISISFSSAHGWTSNIQSHSQLCFIGQSTQASRRQSLLHREMIALALLLHTGASKGSFCPRLTRSILWLDLFRSLQATSGSWKTTLTTRIKSHSYRSFVATSRNLAIWKDSTHQMSLALKIDPILRSSSWPIAYLH